MEVAERQTMLVPGDEIGCYRIESILGKGGFGVTYLALDTMLDMRVAIKEYMPDQIATRVSDKSVQPKTSKDADVFSWGLSRFIKEAQTLARFSHPNIVRVMAVFEQNGTAYMVMEFERGKDLKLQLRHNEYRTQESLKSIIGPIVDGLDEVHRHGYIHRDIKPANIMIRDNGTPVLLDFGSARLATGSQTQNLTALVSVGYAPLEQYSSTNNNQQGPWSDIYALGAVLYFAITGNAPIDSTLRGSAVLNDRPDPLPALVQVAPMGFSKTFCAAIDWSLKFKVADRPQTLSAWRERLLGDDATVIMPAVPSQNTMASTGPSSPPAIVNTSQPRHFSRPTAPAASSAARASATQGRTSQRVSLRTPSQLEAANSTDSTALEVDKSEAWSTSNIHKRVVVHAPQSIRKDYHKRSHQKAPGKRLLYSSCVLLSVSIGAAVIFYYGSNVFAPMGQVQMAAQVGQEQPAQDRTIALERQASVDRALAADEKRRADHEQQLAAQALQKKEQAAIERASAQQLASARQREKDAQEKRQAEEAKREADNERRRLARQAELVRENQRELQLQDALEAQRIAEVNRQASLAREQELEQESQRLANSAAKELASEPQIDSSLPITDNDMATVLDRFNTLMRVIESKNKQALRSMTGESIRKYAYFDYLFTSFDEIEVSIADIEASRLDQTIRGKLEIKRMRRSNGDIAFPPPEFKEIPISSVRYSEWSKINW